MKNILAKQNETIVNTSNPNKKIDYRAVFTGEALCNIEAINPSREDIIKIKNLQNIADRISEPTYINIPLRGENFTKIEFLLSFEPAEYLGDDSNYAEKSFVSYPIFINKELNKNKDGTKCEAIDQHNQTVWIPYDPSKTPGELLDSYIEDVENQGMSENFVTYLKQIDKETLRFARKGETTLYDFIFNMTVLPRHGSTLRDKEGNETTFSLDGFVIGGNPAPEAASKAFEAIVDGDVSYLREVYDSDICKYSDGSKTRVGVFLGGRVNNNDPANVKFYQDVFTNPFEICTFQEGSRPRVWVRNDDGTPKHETRLSKNAYMRLIDENYPWRSEWQNSTSFQVLNKNGYTPPKTEEIIDDLPGPSNKNDDLPF